MHASRVEAGWDEPEHPGDDEHTDAKRPGKREGEYGEQRQHADGNARVIGVPDDAEVPVPDEQHEREPAGRRDPRDGEQDRERERNVRTVERDGHAGPRRSERDEREQRENRVMTLANTAKINPLLNSPV